MAQLLRNQLGDQSHWGKIKLQELQKKLSESGYETADAFSTLSPPLASEVYSTLKNVGRVEDDTAANRPRWLARPGELQQQPIGAHLDGPANALRREQQEEDEKRIPATLRRLCRKFMLQKGETAFGHIPQWRLYLTTLILREYTRARDLLYETLLFGAWGLAMVEACFTSYSLIEIKPIERGT
ncbi:hypothetical protein S40293_07075, partial [Stachybotrys chartarum IBT 40293]